MRPVITTHNAETGTGMSKKEATARIKINQMLAAAGWRFFADGALPANIQLEPSVTLTKQSLDNLG